MLYVVCSIDSHKYTVPRQRSLVPLYVCVFCCCCCCSVNYVVCCFLVSLLVFCQPISVLSGKISCTHCHVWYTSSHCVCWWMVLATNEVFPCFEVYSGLLLCWSVLPVLSDWYSWTCTVLPDVRYHFVCFHERFLSTNDLSPGFEVCCLIVFDLILWFLLKCYTCFHWVLTHRLPYSSLFFFEVCREVIHRFKCLTTSILKYKTHGKIKTVNWSRQNNNKTKQTEKKTWWVTYMSAVDWHQLFKQVKCVDSTKSGQTVPQIFFKMYFITSTVSVIMSMWIRPFFFFMTMDSECLEQGQIHRN